MLYLIYHLHTIGKNWCFELRLYATATTVLYNRRQGTYRGEHFNED